MVHRAAEAMRLVVANEAVGQRLSRQGLHLGVERRANRQPALIELLLALLLQQLTAHFFGEIAGDISVGRENARIDAKRFGFRLRAFVGGHIAVGDQSIDDVVATLEGALAILKRMIIARRLGKRREIGRLGERELIDRFVEIIERRGGDAVVSKAEIDLVEIKLENLVLGIGRFDAEGDERFTNLAFDRALVADEKVLGDLLGDGRGALHMAAALGEHRHGAHHAFRIDADVVVEILVFGGDERLFHQLRNGGTRQEQAAFTRIFGEDRAVAGVQPCRHWRLVVAQLGCVGQILGKIIDQPGPGDRSDEENDRRGREDEAQKPCEHSHEISPLERPAAGVGYCFNAKVRVATAGA